MSIYIEITTDFHWEPELHELWPDGDAPDDIDADTVATLIRKAGGVRRVLRDWNLIDDLELHVIVRRDNPQWQGDQVLFGEPPPRELFSSAAVTP